VLCFVLPARTQQDWYRLSLQRYGEEEEIEGLRFVDAVPGLALGALRNISLDAAAGGIVCQWDDDDCHSERLAKQAEQLVRDRAHACLLTDHLQFLDEPRVLSLIDWTLGGRVANEYRFMPGTLMVRNDDRFRFPESGPLRAAG
jgi:hypothetical protein